MNRKRSIERLKLWAGAAGVFSHRLVNTLRPRRVSVIHQMSAVECGAACLSMILTYYGRKTNVGDCRNQLDVGRDGLTALAIAKAARAHGLRVKAYSLNPQDFQFVQVPAIVHWNFNHFVVVEKWSAGKVVLVDPAIGRLSLTAEEFDAGFTGVVLMFEPGVHFEKTTPPKQSLWRRYLVKYVLNSPALLLQIIGATLLLQVLGLAFPIFTKVLVDYVLPFQVRGVLTICGLGMVLLVVAQAVTSYTRGALLLFIQTRLDSRMMLDFFEHLLSLPFKFFQQRSSGDLLMRLSSNVVIREVLTSQTLSIVLDGSLVLLYLVVILTQASSFGLIVLAIGAVQVCLLLATTRRVQTLMQSDLAAQSKSQSYLVEALTRIEAIKAAGAEERTLDRWSNLFFSQINVSLQRGHLSILIDTGMMSLRLLSPLVLVWFGAYRVLDGSMTLGTMLALNALAAAFLSPLSSLVSNGQRLQLVGSHLERVADVLEAEPEQVNNGEQHAQPALSGCIELNNVSFCYDVNAPEVLTNISLRIESGQKIAIVGRTGSGKSTLGKLLLGLYAPTAGRIMFDDVPLESMNCRDLRRQFGVVLQDSLLFSGSVRQNIAFNDAAVSLDQVKEAARLAVIDDEIEKMPMGYETLVSEGSGGLAGGQRQRLSLARALAHKPVILLLDEATSHLDAITERRVDQNLSRLSCTRIVIAHRLSTIVNADLIVVLDGGKIVERGTHNTLLLQNGLYAELVNSQSEPTQIMAVA